MIPRSSTCKDSHELEPVSGRAVVQLAATLTGLSVSMALSAVITSQSYFEARLAGDPYAWAFTSWYALIFIGVKFAYVLVALATTDRSGSAGIPPGRGSANRGRVMFMLQSALAGYILILLMCTGVFTFLKPGPLLRVLFVLTIALSLTTAKLETEAYTVFARFPSSATQAIMVGQGVAGIWSAGVALAIEALLPGVQKTPTFALCNFGLTLALVTAGALVWIVAAKSEYFQYHDGIGSGPVLATTTEGEPPSYMAVFVKIGSLAMTVFLSCFLATLMFPFAVISTFPVDTGAGDVGNWKRSLFRPVAFFASSLADLVGKWVPGRPEVKSMRLPLLRLASVRVLIFGMLLAGNIRLDSRTLPWSPRLASDRLFFALLIVSGVVNGFCTTAATMRVPERVNDLERPVAARIASLCNQCGMFLGILASVLLTQFLHSISVNKT